MKKSIWIMVVVYGYVIATWVINLVKLLNCNFAEPWKDEAIHAFGLIPPVAWVTAWM